MSQTTIPAANRQAAPPRDGVTVCCHITRGGVTKCYTLRPMGAEELREDQPQGFTLRNKEERTEYTVCMDVDGVVTCTCPGFDYSRSYDCKHTRALKAAKIIDRDERLAIAKLSYHVNQCQIEAEDMKALAQSQLEETGQIRMAVQQSLDERDQVIAQLRGDLETAKAPKKRGRPRKELVA